MVLALDGHAQSVGTTSTGGTLSVSATGLTFVLGADTGAPASTYSNTGRSAWFWAVAALPLSSKSITASSTAGGSASASLTTTQPNDVIVACVEGEWLSVFGISGANISGPDSNVSLPGLAGDKTVAGMTMKVNGLSTTHANCFVFAGYFDGDNVAPTAGPGYTIIDGTMGDGASEYQIISSPLSGATVAFGGAQGSAWAMSAGAFYEASVVPVTVTYSTFRRVTVTNAQPSATLATFQQEFFFDPRKYVAYAKADLGNIRFYYDAAFTKPIKSWLESGVVTSPQAIFWLLLTASIPAGRSTTVYMVFQTPISTEFDGIIAGQAPQLSASYGAFDNGATIFPTFYDNFTGSSISAGWNVSGATGGYAVDDGLTLSPYLIEGFVFSTEAAYNGPLVVDALQNTGALTGVEMGLVFSDANTPNTEYPFLRGANSAMETGITNATGVFSIEAYSTTSTATGPMITQSVPQTTPQVTGLAVSISEAFATENYENPVSVNPTFPINVTANYAGMWLDGASPGASNFIQWFRLRSYPPNGVMPSAVVAGVPPTNSTDELESGLRQFLISDDQP